MKKLLVLLLLLLSGQWLTAQEKMVRLTRFEGADITGVIAASAFKVELYQGEETRAEVEIPAEVESKIGFTDKEHLRIEALLNGIDEENLSKGLVSYIKDGTRLIGLSIKNGIAYVVLSDEFLESKDIGKAKHQIEETLRMENPDLRVAIIVDDEII